MQVFFEVHGRTSMQSQFRHWALNCCRLLFSFHDSWLHMNKKKEEKCFIFYLKGKINCCNKTGTQTGRHAQMLSIMFVLLFLRSKRGIFCCGALPRALLQVFFFRAFLWVFVFLSCRVGCGWSGVEEHRVGWCGRDRARIVGGSCWSHRVAADPCSEAI